MTDRKMTSILVLSSFALSLLASCQSSRAVDVEDKEFIEQILIDFTKGEPNPIVMAPSNGYSNGGAFGCTWSKDCVTYNESGMQLNMYRDDTTAYGGEMKTVGGDGLFDCGYFKATMRPSDVNGTASTFFLYTGEGDGNPHDEIDIEFLGKDTSKVQFNFFKDGVGHHEYMYDLGFDAAEEFHDYGFYWDYSKIIWYVDDKPVYEIMGDVPTHRMRMFTNFWCGDQTKKDITDWMGKINAEELPAFCSYKKLYYADIDGRGITVPEKGSDSSFKEANAIHVSNDGFTSNNNYTVNKVDDGYDVSFVSTEGSYAYIAPNGYSGKKFGKPEYAVLKIKNLSDASYDVLLSYYNGENEYVGLDGEVISEKNNSSLKKKGSTSIYYTLGAGDTATFKTTLAEGITRFSKMNLLAAPNSNTCGSFKIMDWYIYDSDPVDDTVIEEGKKTSLMNNGFGGNYTVTKNGDAYDVEWSQSQGAFKNVMVNNPASIVVSKPESTTVKLKNNSNTDTNLIISLESADQTYLTTGGVLKSSAKGNSSYTRHGSTAEYYVLGAGDTAEFEAFVNNSVTSYRKIEIICEPKTTTDCSGSFTILDWYISE
ncbi:MAG: family 16 glycosylhydrolase [Bacilli bacterium]|nr:family 16 glycosylhydrolase [Bacilli bacterium]